MRNWMDERATLDVEVGSGWISRYEFERMVPSCVIRARTEAGVGCTVRLNGAFFAAASVLVSWGSSGESALLAALIDSLEETTVPEPPPSRGDLAADLLPFTIKLASLDIALGALEGVGPRSLIDLGRVFACPQEAELAVAGIPVARGTVAVIGENMGLRVTELFVQPPSRSLPRTTGSLLAPDYTAEPVKDYDFCRPDCFTRRAITRVFDIHLSFLRGWQACFPELTGWKLTCVDQLTYGEWLESGAASAESALASGSILPFRPATLDRAYTRDDAPGVPATFLVAAEGSPHSLGSARAAALRDWLSRALSASDALPYFLAGRIVGTLNRDRDPGLAVTLACLRNAWLAVSDIRVGLAAGAEAAYVADRPLPPDAVSAHAMIILVSFESAQGERLDVAYSQRLLAPHLPALGR